MIIEVNNSKTYTVHEQCLIVINGKLLNNMTNKFEGVDGDKVTFYNLDKFGHKCWISGTVEGYTCNRRIKLKGVKELYACYNGAEKTIDHSSTITDCDTKGVVDRKVETKPTVEVKTKAEEDWELVLSA